MELSTNIVNYGNGIYAIDQQMVRAFLVVGDAKAILLDTGAVRIDIWSHVREITELPVEVILTHGDGDHIGNLQDFEEAYIKQEDMEAVLLHEHCKEVRLREMREGDVFDIGGRKLKVLFTPGHTAGSCCLLDEENKILFAGDTVSYGPVFMFGERRNMTAFISSLCRLKQMKEDKAFETIYCCHNECPVSLDAIEDLIACAKAIQSGKIKGEEAHLPIPTEDRVLIGKRGKCSILFE